MLFYCINTDNSLYLSIMILFAEIKSPKQRLSLVIQYGLAGFYLVFIALRGFHHHDLPMPSDVCFGQSGSSETLYHSYHDSSQCPLCIFTSSQDIQESPDFVSFTDAELYLTDAPDFQRIDVINGGYYSPRAPPAFSLY